MSKSGRHVIDKPIERMTLAEVQAELHWRLLAQGQMVGNLYPTINGERIEKLRERERELEYPPCLRCHKTVNLAGARRCNNCWEVESRIEEYLASPAGREHVLHILGQIKERAARCTSTPSRRA